MQKLLQSSQVLASKPELRSVMNLQGIDVIATRLWFDRRVEMRFPANVLSGFDDSYGGTFFDLNQLQVCQGWSTGRALTCLHFR
jgi:hypothetical protein